MKDLHGKDGRKKGGERKKQMDGATLPKKTLQFADRNVSP